MTHFDKASETSKTPSETDKLVAELVSMFGFHPGDSEQSEPTVDKTFDDDREVKESAIAKLERLLEIRRAEAGVTNRDVLALALENALAEGAVPETITRVIEILDPPQLVSAAPPLLTGDLPLREWLIKDWLPANCVSMFTGEGGVGKSYAALQIACALISGVKDCYFDAKDLPIENAELPSISVVYAAWEDELEEVSRRIRRIKGNLQWPDFDKIERGFSFVDLKKLGPIWGPEQGVHVSTRGGLLHSGQELLRICEEKPARLLVLDPGAGAFGGNENDRAAVREFTGYMSGWGVDNKCATLIISHPPKSGETYSGSTDWLGSVRSLWNLGLRTTKLDDKEVKYYSLTHEKSNYSLRQSEICLEKGKYGVWLRTDSPEEVQVDGNNETRETVNFR